MDINQQGSSTRITASIDAEVRINAAGATVTVTELGRLLGGLVFTAGGSSLVIDEGGVVMRGNPGFSNPTTAITGSAGSDVVLNNGSINGDVLLGDGADRLTSSRLIGGRIDMGGGDDVIRLLELRSSGFASVDGGPGNDRLELVNSGQSSSSLTISNVETIVLDGAFGSNSSNDLRITSLWGLSGVQRLDVIGDGPDAAAINGPQFYVRSSTLPLAMVQISGRAALYLDGTSVAAVAGDAAGNSLALWGPAQVTGLIDLGGGDDFLSIMVAGSAGLAGPVRANGGAGADTFSITLDDGASANLSLADVAGFETVWFSANRGVAATITARDLAATERLLLFGPLTVNLMSTTAPAMRVEGDYRALSIAAGSSVGALGFDFGNFAQENANPLKSRLITNAGAINGGVFFEEGDDRYDGRHGSVAGPVDGGAGNDELLGGAGNEDLRGGLGADRLDGNGGNDRLTGGRGTDQLDGGAGHDTAVFSGLRRDYEISRTGASVTVRDLRAGGDGTDTLTNIEQARFADGQINLLPEQLLLFLPGSRDVIGWDSARGADGFRYFLRVGGTNSVIAAADLTGDGSTDLLFRQANGDLIRWDVTQGGGGFAALPSLPGFSVVAVGDLVGNGAQDILLQGSDGTLRVIDAAAGSAGNLFTLAPGWTVKGVANINGTGKADVILQNGSGTVIAFTDTGWRDLLTLGTGWQIKGFGDVAGGLADEFILQNTAGTTIFWDATLGSAGWQDFATIAPGWSIAGLFDLGGDGRDDVLLRHDNGAAIFWTGSGWGDLGDVLARTDLIGTGLFG